MMMAIFVIVIGAVCILGWHHLSPERWHWLDEKALRDIKNFVLSDAVVGLGTNYIRRFLETRTSAFIPPSDLPDIMEGEKTP